MSDPVRYVLARAAENGFFEAVVPASAPFDPLLRASIRRRARRAFASASSATSVTDEAHVLRLAFLRVAGVAAPPPDDVESTKLAFEHAKQLEPRRGRAFWPATFSSLGALLVGSIALGLFLWWPTPRERFEHTALGEAMSDGLTDWTVGIGRRDVGHQDKGREALLAKGVKRQIGDGAFDLLGTALEQSKAVAGAMSPEDAARETKALDSTLHSLDAELQAKKLPAYFDEYADSSAFTGMTNVWLIGYWVDARTTISVGSKSIPILRGSRLDNLNLEIGGKAYESKVLGGWVVSTDEVADWVVRNVIPALGKDRPFAFGAQRPQEEGSSGRLASKAGEKIRADLLGRAKLEPDDATQLADLLLQRHTAFVRLAVLGDEMFEPRGIAAKPKLVRALKRRKTENDANEILRIEDRLSPYAKSFDRIVDAQASLDELRVATLAACGDDGCTVKADDEMGKAIGGSGYQGANAAAIASKLVMIARSETPYLAFAEAEMGTGGYASVWAVERELGLSPGWMSPYGVTDDAEHGQLGVAAFDKPADVLRKAAESAYQKLFGAPMPPITRASTPR